MDLFIKALIVVGPPPSGDMQDRSLDEHCAAFYKFVEKHGGVYRNRQDGSQLWIEFTNWYEHERHVLPS